MNIDLQDKLFDVRNYLDRGETLISIMYGDYFSMSNPGKTFELNYKEMQTLIESSMCFLCESKKMLEDILK